MLLNFLNTSFTTISFSWIEAFNHLESSLRLSSWIFESSMLGAVGISLSLLILLILKHCKKETYFFYYCPIISEFVFFVKQNLTKANYLQNGIQRYPFFICNKFDIISVENILILYTRKYGYKLNVKNTIPNIVQYLATSWSFIIVYNAMELR